VTDTGLCAMYAASHPDEVTALVLWGATANGADATPPDERERRLEIVERAWGEGHMLPLYAPSRAGDARFTAWWARYERAIASPGMVRKLADLALRTDLRDVLPLIRVPTLVLHRHDDAVARVDLGRDVAARIPGARFLELSGGDNYPWAGDVNAFLDPMEEFLTGARGEHLPDRVLTTVVFTDLVGSTERAASMGDRRWRGVLQDHHAVVREELARWRGVEVKATGDGFLATFDGPARAIRCAASVAEAMGTLGLEVRAGLHTGELEVMDGDLGGLAVHIASRVMNLAGPNEVLVSGTVKDLVVGSGIDFEERGERELRGVPGEWRLYAVS
jgi:class 3 adenylate cyclase